MKWLNTCASFLLLDGVCALVTKNRIQSLYQLRMSENYEANTNSVARDWAKNQADDDDEAKPISKARKKFVVIGGGWGGWGAAKALCQSGINADVTLIDALPDPTGVRFIVMNIYIYIYLCVCMCV